MECDPFREVLSAQLDGEDQPGEYAFATAHLRICGDCRQWLDQATALSRLTRQLPDPAPDLTDAILAAMPHDRTSRLRMLWRRAANRERLVPALRLLLGTLGAVQILLGVAQIAAATNGANPHGAGHLWHESAAWNVAVGAGFLWIAVRRGRAAGMVPTLTAFVAVLLLLTANDMMVATVDLDRVLSHGFMVAGYLAVLLLTRATRDTGTPPAAKQPTTTDQERNGTGHQPAQRPPLRLLNPPPTPQARHRDAA